MNYKIMASVLVIFFCLVLTAQAKPKEDQVIKPITADDIINKLKEPLELTDQQADRAKLVIADYLEREKQLKLEERKELSKIFTKDQLYSWDDLQRQVGKEKKKHAAK